MIRFTTFGFALVATVASVSAPSMARAQVANESAQLRQVLEARTTQRDGRFAGQVAPGLYLVDGSPEQRLQEANQRLVTEANVLLQAFASGGDDQRVGLTLKALSAFDAETARDGAARLFFGRGPSMSIMRQIVFVPADRLGANAVQKVMEAVSSFELLPKPEDYYYVYSNALSLSQSRAPETRGASGSHLRASQTMADNAPYAIKKCRHVLFTWYCNTSQYVQQPVSSSSDSARLLVTTLVDLKRNNDSPDFNRDSRTSNIVEGYTGFYLVKRAGNVIMIYNSGVQHGSDAPRLQGRLNEGHKVEYRQLVERLRSTLGVSPLR